MTCCICPELSFLVLKMAVAGVCRCMSEYQFVHFIAIDRPLNDEQLEFMRRQSTRATVTRREFTNEYHFGDFHGQTLEMMRRGFDLHVHFANYGVRQIMIRLPHGFPGGNEILEPYLIEYDLEWECDAAGPGGVLSIHPESDGGRWDNNFSGLEDLLHELTPVRDMLINGDLRPVYLAWLACQPFESPEPPVPAGMGSLPDALHALANFYEINNDLLEAAAEESDSVTEPVEKTLPVQAWFKTMSEQQRLQLLEALLADDSGLVRAETLQSIRKTLKTSAWPVRQTSRTMDDLHRLAEERSQIRVSRENQAKEKQRKKRLDGMAKNPADTVAKVFTMIATKSTAKY
jgi:hypothetical protein